MGHLRILLILIFTAATGLTQNTRFTSADSVRAIRLTEKIVIDGVLTEQVWHNGDGVRQFTQRDPKEGKPATLPTQVHVAFDQDAIYIGARMHDSSPDSIQADLGRKDEWLESDVFGVFLDPYLDRRTGYFFGLSAGGTYYDGVLMNDDWDDDSWDGVWEGKVQIDQQGWSLEMRIPYSQLRFHPGEECTWGINFRRDIPRRQEEDFLVYTPKDGSGFVSRFPVLVGLEKLSAAGGTEILPYVRAKAEYLQVDAGDPYVDDRHFLPGAGVDFKIPLSSNLILDATINPDFGQVEVDPAIINLDDYETYYSEKRPFFIEGASIFSFGQGGATSNWGFNWGNPNFFYSRRIGSAPAGSLPDYDYANIPDGTRILGAAKLTGKIGSGWNIGTVHAVTGREYADLSLNGIATRPEVEPAAYFGVVRAQKDIDEGMHGIGMIGTFTGRSFKDERLQPDYNKNASALGVDGWTFLDRDREWVVNGWLGMSHITGSKERLQNVQESWLHYFQRPDASHISFDPNRTAMTGYAGRLAINKQKGSTMFNSAIGVIDPCFNVQDMGYAFRNDVINAHVAGGYKWVEPTDYYRSIWSASAVFLSSDFEHNITWAGLFTVNEIEFPNYYELELQFAWNPRTVNTRRTRGGPKTINNPGFEFNISGHTDRRKTVVFELGTSGYTLSKNDNYRSVEAEVEWRPASNVRLSFNPSFTWNREQTQWIDVYDDPFATETFGKRYVFGEMYQKELAASFRVNWTFTPQLSLQLYVQPLISTGDFSNFKELARPESYDFNKFGEGGSDIRIEGETYIVDPDGNGPAGEFRFDNPDFSYRSFRANAVMRWEYLPGSTFFLVWTQNRWTEADYGDFRMSRAMDTMFSNGPDNILMAKLTYWLNY